MKLIHYFVFFLLFLAITKKSVAQPYWTIGPKIGYTFGNGGGFTGGVEVSYFPYRNFLPGGFGYTFDLTAWPNHRSVHVGAEFASLLGIDVGPTVFLDSGRVSGGVSMIPWIGAVIYGYFELDIPFGHVAYQSVGGYLKYPFLPPPPAW